MLPGTPLPKSAAELILSDLEPPESWIEPMILPRRAKLLFGGQAKIGKSMIMLELARALSTGQSPFGWPTLTVPRPVRVLLLEQEIGEWGLWTRMKKIFQEENIHQVNENFTYISRQPILKFDTDTGFKMLKDIVRYAQPEVLLIDPIGKMQAYDENSNSEIAKLFDQLDQLLKLGEPQGMSLVIAHHFGKPRFNQDGYDPLDPYNFRGASKWFDDPDTIVTCQRMNEQSIPGTKDRRWELKTRWTLRHDGGPEDTIFRVNWDQDLRVKWGGKLRNGLTKPISFAHPEGRPEPLPDATPVEGTQLMFTPPE